MELGAGRRCVSIKQRRRASAGGFRVISLAHLAWKMLFLDARKQKANPGGGTAGISPAQMS